MWIKQKGHLELTDATGVVWTVKPDTYSPRNVFHVLRNGVLWASRMSVSAGQHYAETQSKKAVSDVLASNRHNEG